MNEEAVLIDEVESVEGVRELAAAQENPGRGLVLELLTLSRRSPATPAVIDRHNSVID
jgi:hypothetical protein